VTPRPPPIPRALIFDLDGTLVDSRADIASACNAALTAEGVLPLPDNQILRFVGDGAPALVARALKASVGAARAAELQDRTLEAFQEHYEAHPCARTVLLPGAREVLQTSLPSAVVTNKPRAVAELVLDGLAIRSAFAAVWGGGDGPLKPDPAGIRSVLKAVGVAAAEAWMIGDGPQDVLAGKAAGAFTIAIPGIADEARLREASPDLVVSSLLEVAELVRMRSS
jgi:phosphoglycolate phosphatase